MKFSDLGLAEPFLRAAESLGYETATPIQVEAIPVVLAGRDLIGCAQTGTGKTAAYTLPMLDRLMQMQPARPTSKPIDGNRGGPKGVHPKARALRALILAPTRELAAQIGASLERYGKFTPLRQTVIFGGVSQFSQVNTLRHGVDALVATPGRLLDLMEQGHVDLSKIEVLIFDEADQMLDMGFLPDLKRIVARVPTRRQTLMFSATMPAEIRRLAQQWLRDPAAIEVGPVATPVERVTQTVHLVDKKRKPDLLTWFLKETPRARTLVFSRTKHGADKIVKRLKKEGLRAAAIHGDKSQGTRSRTLAQFKSENPPVLVATDVAARGLDINNVSHVVNFDLPETPEIYIHRIGRTARAGAEGTAVSFCAGDERGLLQQIERLIRLAITVEPTIDGFELTDPISHGQSSGRRNGGSRNGNRAGARNQPYGKPRRNGAGNGSASSDEQPRPSKGRTDGPAKQKKARPAGGAAARGAPCKRRRRRHTTKL
jgi:ATP-dependent RNA helicase RhlE